MFKRMLSIVLLLSIVMVACSNQTTENGTNFDIGNPTPEEILAENEDADIFLRNGIVYSNAEHIIWINEEELTLGEEVGEIRKQTNNREEFENYTATKLPIGTVIYETVERNGPILIVIVDNKEIRYLGLIEG